MRSLAFLGILFCLVNSVNAQTIKEIYREYQDSVLLVSVTEKDGKSSHGTAFAIDEKGETFLTAAHVLSGSGKIELITNQSCYTKPYFDR